MLTDAQRLNLMGVTDTRHDRRPPLQASQIPVDRWHAVIGDQTYAEAILDRLFDTAYRLEFTSESVRKRAAAKVSGEAS